MGISSGQSRKRQLIVLYVIALAGGVFVIIFWLAGIILWLIVVGIGLYFFVRWHAENSAYLCYKCGHLFVISALTDFISPHFPDKKLLKCPQCHESSWCREKNFGKKRPAFARIWYLFLLDYSIKDIFGVIEGFPDFTLGTPRSYFFSSSSRTRLNNSGRRLKQASIRFVLIISRAG